MAPTGNETCSVLEQNTINDWSLNQLVHLICITIVPFTIVLNIIVIVKINLRKKHKFVTRFLLSSLAVVDMCVGFIVMPFMITNAFYDVRNFLGAKICLLINSADVLLSSASIIHLFLLTYDRYVAICKPFDYGKYCGKKVMLTLYVLCWVLVGAVSFGIIMPEFHLIGIDPEYFKCLDMNTKSCIFVTNKYFVIFSSTATIFLPGTFITAFNIKLFFNVRRNSVVRRKYHINVLNTHKSRQTSKSMRVAKTIAVLTGCFFVCWLPFFVVNIIHTFERGREQIEYVIVQWLGYLNSAMNPFLYLLLETKSCIGRG